MVPRAGLEPARANAQEILSLSCLPFHHRGVDVLHELYHDNRAENDTTTVHVLDAV